ncbi:DegT/DnrJ/EryC1/StrS aminotransferase family protein [Candidatus Pelagibacter sp.]|nr:DegT/DnrJ/EryC1/StrS aminotransferase family protein [Candidatus Pelagibacter sp.]
MKNIRFSIPNITNEDVKIVGKILKSGWLTHGKYTTLFEEKFKEFTGAKYAVTVSSCTAALHLSCLASNFKKGDEVIVPAQTHTATAHAVEYTGAKAIFADVDLLSGNVSLEELKKNITKKTKGIIVVHMAGEPCDMIKISKFCKKKNIALIEDCAHGVGSFLKKKHVGNFGISGNFSFYPTKQITTGEGGIMITNDKKFYEKVKTLKAFGIDKDINNRKKQGDYDVKKLGFNYRMTDFQAALGFKQLSSYKKNLKRRHEIAKRYVKNFSESDQIKHMPFSKNCSYFIFQIFCEKRDLLLKYLKEKGIGVSVHYSNPLPKMTYYKEKYKLNIKSYSNADKYGKTNISLPMYPLLKNSDIDIICKTILTYKKNEE